MDYKTKFHFENYYDYICKYIMLITLCDFLYSHYENILLLMYINYIYEFSYFFH